MRKLIETFTSQLSEALEIGQNATLTPCARNIHHVLITGMGGSGIGGTIISELATEVKVPIIINKSYDLPHWVNEHTLVIGSTYSGNTEETIAVIEAALAKNAEVAFVTSGGRALELATQHQLNHIVVPGGNPPRSMLGFSLVELMFLLNHYGITQFQIEKDWAEVIDLLNAHHTEIDHASHEVAKKINNTLPIIYAAAGYDGIATRLRQQINENSKMLCWHHIIPEMNHNELVGWAGGDAAKSVLILRNEDDSAKNQLRMDINKTIISRYTSNIIEIWSKGESKLAKMMYHVNFGDWISLHLGEMRGVDIVEIEVINFLKSELAK